MRSAREEVGRRAPNTKKVSVVNDGSYITVA